ncbi:uncharacterized protein HKW66_Vig0188500 [Vigna angularis]|uniref:Uncharacterized protein n=1 Tax=Phaseolus angularis TaxID=3914 RepID=A0A8T0KZE5_PHAAN|nr:uncharacterized protein HKW66_Vig0188500 [Vigna angularis]
MSTPLHLDFPEHLLAAHRELNLERDVDLDSIREMRRFQRDRSDGELVEPQLEMRLLVPYCQHRVRVLHKALEMEEDRLILLRRGVYRQRGHSEGRYFEGGKVGCEDDTQEYDGHPQEAEDDHGSADVEEVDVEVTVVHRHGEFVTVEKQMRMRSFARKCFLLKVFQGREKGCCRELGVRKLCFLRRKECVDNKLDQGLCLYYQSSPHQCSKQWFLFYQKKQKRQWRVLNQEFLSLIFCSFCMNFSDKE